MTRQKAYTKFAIDRLERLREHIRLQSDLTSPIVCDLLLCWFILCHHTLFDWSYEALLPAKKEAEKKKRNQLLNASWSLRLCRDIADATKHLNLRRWKGNAQEYDPGLVMFGSMASSGVPTIICRTYDPFTSATELEIPVGGKNVSPFQLMDDCLREVKEAISELQDN